MFSYFNICLYRSNFFALSLSNMYFISQSFERYSISIGYSILYNFRSSTIVSTRLYLFTGMAFYINRLLQYSYVEWKWTKKLLITTNRTTSRQKYAIHPPPLLIELYCNVQGFKLDHSWQYYNCIKLAAKIYPTQLYNYWRNHSFPVLL